MAKVVQGTKQLRAKKAQELTDKVAPGHPRSSSRPGRVKQSIRVGSTLKK